MSTHNIGFYEKNKQNYHFIIIKYHQIRTLFLLLYGLNTKTTLQRKADIGKVLNLWTQNFADIAKIYFSLLN